MNVALTALRPPLANERPVSYEKYHYDSLEAGDIDPSYEMLRYLCRRFDLNMEQRFWLAFLYATCYCGPTVYAIYNEFPDFNMADEGRLERWWSESKSKLYFQTDRRWIRSRNQWCDVFRSYRGRVGKLSQQQFFSTFKTPDPLLNYENAWRELSSVYQMGRFAMFLWLEAIHVVTGFPMKPSGMDMREAESCRNGLAFAIRRPDLNTHDGAKISIQDQAFLQDQFNKMTSRMQSEDPRNTIWNIETSLCAYKKYCFGKRWVGYYLDRQAEEIEKLQGAVKDGVDWSVLWDYRRETYQTKFLKEFR